MKINQRGEACYSSFRELAKSMNLKPVTHVTKNEEKLKKQQDFFRSKHKCKACGNPMTWVGGNIMTCLEPSCRGIKITKEDDDGNKIISYVTSYKLLDNRGAEIASNIFKE